MPSSEAKRPFIHILTISFILFLFALWAFRPPLTFMNSDVGLRFIQIRALVAQNWQTFAVPYATEIDPNFEFVPYYYAYSLLDNDIYFNISPFFPLIVSYLYAALGQVGLIIVPVLGTAVTAWAIFQLATLLEIKRPYLLMWTAVFGTPMLFYSAQLWDHTIGTGLAVAGVALAVKGVFVDDWRISGVGGILLGLSLGQRPELYLFVLAFGVAGLLHYWRKRPFMFALLGGGVVGVVPLWLYQAIWFGHPFGMALATNLLGYGRPSAYPLTLSGYPRAFVMGQFMFHIEARDPVTFLATLAVLIGIVLFVFALRILRYQKTAILYTAVGLTAVGYLLWATVALNDLVTGFISTFPLIGLSLAFVDRQEQPRDRHHLYRFVFTMTLLYLAGMVLFWPAFGARLWGSRYLLTAYPLMLLLAFYAVENHQVRMEKGLGTAVQAIFTFLIILSVAFQLLGMRFNYQAINQLEAERILINEQAVDAVLTNHPFWPALMASEDDKLFFYTQTNADVEEILPRLFAHNVRHVAVISLASEPLTLPEQLGTFTITPAGGIVYHLDPLE